MTPRQRQEPLGGAALLGAARGTVAFPAAGGGAERDRAVRVAAGEAVSDGGLRGAWAGSVLGSAGDPAGSATRAGDTWGGCPTPGDLVGPRLPRVAREAPHGAGLASPPWEGALRILPRVPNHRVTKLAGCRRPIWLPGDGLHEDGNCQVTRWLLDAGTPGSVRRPPGGRPPAHNLCRGPKCPR